MKRLILLFIGLTFSLSVFSQDYNVLPYEPGKKLVWQDFQGKPKPTDRHKGAEITVSIFLRVKETNFWSGKITYDAYAVAFKDESWVRPAYKDDYSLKHEQTHFDIAHLYAETLEIKLNSLDKDKAKDEKEVARILKEHLVEMQKFQDRYDRETQGGNNYAKQKKWFTKIDKAISILNNPA